MKYQSFLEANFGVKHLSLLPHDDFFRSFSGCKLSMDPLLIKKDQYLEYFKMLLEVFSHGNSWKLSGQAGRQHFRERLDVKDQTNIK